MRSVAIRAVRCSVLLLAVWLRLLVPAEASEPRAYVFLWFDTEDYLLPADDDATLRLCEFLTAENIRATFKLVGEKARVLETRGRKDVIEALQKHEIGYHSEFHSVQPTPALYMSQQGWDDGVAEFDRRERQGVLDIERIFGQKPSCYGQPGSSWGPQQFGAMRQWDMPVFLDAGRHVSLDGGPFWYCGILNLYALKATLRTGLGGPKDVEQAKTQFDKAYEQLLAEGGGPVSIYYHPCEFVHAKFWDGVNFSAGANPPRSQWKVPPQKTPDESRVAYDAFESYIRFIKGHANVQFVTAREGVALYRDRAVGRSFSPREVREIASRVARPNGINSLPRQRGASSLGGVPKGGIADDEISFQRFGDYSLSAGESLLLLNQFATATIEGKAADSVTLAESPFGPTQASPPHERVSTDRSQFERTVLDVAGYMERLHRVPNAVWLGSTPISPESYLATLAKCAETLADGKPLPDEIHFMPRKLHAASYVSDDRPELWGWVIFPPKFRAPAMMDLAKRQAWTLKPAMLTGTLEKPQN